MLAPRVDGVTPTLTQVLLALIALAGGAGSVGALISAGAVVLRAVTS